MLADTLTKIRKQHGYLLPEDVAEIRKDICNPSMQILVRHGRGRFLCPLNELEWRLANVEREGDYVRDVCIPANPKPLDWFALGYKSPLED